MFSSVVIIDYGIKNQLDSAKPILTKYIKVYEEYSRSIVVDGDLDLGLQTRKKTLTTAVVIQQTPDHINLINIGPTIDNRHNWRIVSSITYSRHCDKVMRVLMGQRLSQRMESSDQV